MTTAAQLMSKLPSFWRDYFGDADMLRALYAGQALHANANEAALDAARDTVDPLRVDYAQRATWWPLVLRSQDKRVQGTSSVYGNNIAEQYGDIQGDQRYVFDLPAGLQAADRLHTTITIPGTWLLHGIEFEIANGKLHITVDPFTLSDAAVQPVFAEDGSVTGQTVTLWLHNAEFDAQWVDRRAGCFFNLQGDATPEYAEFIRKLYRVYTYGATIDNMLRCACAAAGTSALEPDERIVAVLPDAVVTDTRVCPIATTSAVAVGDVVDMVMAPCTGITWDVYVADGVSIPAGRGYVAGLNFVNAVTTGLQVSTNADDSALFWQQARDAAGGAANLARIVARLPYPLNPYELFIEQIAGSIAVLTVDTAALTARAPGLEYLEALVNALPAHMRVVLNIRQAINLRTPVSATADTEAGDGAEITHTTTLAPSASLVNIGHGEVGTASDVQHELICTHEAPVLPIEFTGIGGYAEDAAWWMPQAYEERIIYNTVWHGPQPCPCTPHGLLLYFEFRRKRTASDQQSRVRLLAAHAVMLGALQGLPFNANRRKLRRGTWTYVGPGHSTDPAVRNPSWGAPWHDQIPVDVRKTDVRAYRLIYYPSVYAVNGEYLLTGADRISIKTTKNAYAGPFPEQYWFPVAPE